MAAHKHSGSLGMSALLGPLLATIAAVVLALAYAYIDVYSPIAGYISILFVIGFGVGLILALSLIGHVSKCRSPGFMTVLGLWTGVVALYASWAFFEYALISRHGGMGEANMLDVLLSPVAVWEVATEINAEGWYSLRSFTPSGIVLWVLWGLEAVIILLAGLLGGSIALSGKVFCERCGAWADDSPEDLRLGLPQDGELSPEVQAGHVAALWALPPVGGGRTPHLKVEMKKCTTCDETASARVKLVTYEADDKGKVSENTEDLSETNAITNQDYQYLVALAQRPRAEAQAAQPIA